jgi:hypothetical protein
MPVQRYAIETILNTYRDKMIIFLTKQNRATVPIPYDDTFNILYNNMSQDATRLDTYNAEVEAINAAAIHLRHVDPHLCGLVGLFSDKQYYSNPKDENFNNNTATIDIVCEFPALSRYKLLSKKSDGLRALDNGAVQVKTQASVCITQPHLHIGTRGNKLFTRELCSQVVSDASPIELPEPQRVHVKLQATLIVAYHILYDILFRCNTIVQVFDALPPTTHPLFLENKSLVRLLEKNKNKRPKQKYILTDEGKSVLNQALLPLIMYRELNDIGSATQERRPVTPAAFDYTLALPTAYLSVTEPTIPLSFHQLIPQEDGPHYELLDLI